MQLIKNKKLWIGILFIFMIAATIVVQRYQNKKLQLYKSGILVYHNYLMKGENYVQNF